MNRAMAKLHDWSKLTGRHKLAVVILAMWGAITVRIFLSFDPVWISAQATNYATLTSSALLFAAASLGITKWGDIQTMQMQIPSTTQPPLAEEPA